MTPLQFVYNQVVSLAMTKGASEGQAKEQAEQCQQRFARSDLHGKRMSKVIESHAKEAVRLTKMIEKNK